MEANLEVGSEGIFTLVYDHPNFKEEMYDGYIKIVLPNGVLTIFKDGSYDDPILYMVFKLLS